MSKHTVSLSTIIFSIACLFAACKDSDKKDAAASPRNQPQGGQGGAGRQGNMPVQAEGFIVKTRPMSEDIEVPGNILPFEETEIRPEISGKIVSLNVREGNAVGKGVVLAKLYDGDLQAQLKKLQVQMAIAQKTVERYGELLKIQGISQQEYDLAQLQVNNLRADMDLVRVDIGRTEIRSPYAGRLGLRNISVGAYVSPTTIITTLRRVDQLKLEFSVPEKYSVAMKTGSQVKFSLEGTSQKFTANVIATEAFIEANTRTLRVRSLVKEKNPSLLPGGFAKVNLQMGNDAKSIVVPTQAVIPQARNKRVIVYNGGAAKFQIVSTGIRDSSFVQIIDGLNVGDTVVTTGLLAIRPDSKIKLVKVQ
ncbi:MAG: efflux RND transporter periplasmic adaptor subunit [Chitinophagaceae bacterium]